PSWIDLAEIRVNTTESRFVTCLNRLLQQNRPEPDLRCWLSRGSQVTHSMPYRYLDLSSILPSFDARKAT
ncbi:hypothetical protein, partial [Bradyrhizobium sp. F1.13.3]|uniref:hypothetical protein n=1 Tax=Bradyrhizobium sp. F1.13.3 TaxID=3156351 RepID=UPI003393913F